MWQCARCGESVEDTFDTCWKCGAAADGTINSEFGPEPDDPSVPDPGPDSEIVHQESDRDAPPISSRGIDRRELAALICKTLALILFAVATVISVTAVLLLLFMLLAAPHRRSMDSQELFVFLVAGVPVLAIVSVGILYWKKSNWIASRMVPADPSPVAIPPFTVQDAMIVAFSTVGLVFLFDSVRDVSALIYIVQEYSIAASEFWYDSRTWSAIIQLALALWLILGSRGIVAVIHRFRTAGTPQDNDCDDENAS